MSPFAALAGTFGAVDLRPGPRQLPLRTSYESIFLGLRRAPSSGDSVIHLRPLHRRRFLHMRSRFCCARYPSSRCFSSRQFLRGRLHRRLSWGDTPTHTQHYSASVPPCYPALSSWGVTVNCTTYPSLLQGYSLIFMGGFAISLRLLLFATITFLIFSLPDTNNTYAVYTYHFTTSSNIIPIQRIGFWEEPLCIHDEHIGFGRSHSTIIRNGHTIYNMGGGFDYFPISWILF